MYRASYQPGSEPPSPHPRLSRAQSNSSNRDGRPPLISLNTLPAPPQLTPEPAYIAHSAAAHVVASGLANRGTVFASGEEIDDQTSAGVSKSALVLLNAFLDQLLYSFLSSSRSTSILSLKPAIAEILKPRLAKEAIDGADEELRGYMAGGDDEELLDFHNGQELRAGANLHHVFKRTRLRCMVYTRLGDLEEDDEEAYLESESPEEEDRLARDFGNVSPAAAIFLTSVIEFIGEEALIVAGANAVNRMGSGRQESNDYIAVESHDVEKIAFNKTLGRLWRSWKKAGRTTSMISPRNQLYDLRNQRKTVSEGASRSTSVSDTTEQHYFLGRLHSHVAGDDQDVRPGGKASTKLDDLPDEPDMGPQDDVLVDDRPKVDRRRSIMDFAFPLNSMEHKNSSTADVEEERTPRRPVSQATKKHRRASSMPAVRSALLSSPVEETFTTPTEEPRKFSHEKSTLADADDIPQDGEESDSVSQLVSHQRGLSNSSLRAIPLDPNLPSRGVSMSEYSEQSFNEDPHMTPQALNFQKSQSKAHGGTFYDGSRPSTKTSIYSVHDEKNVQPSTDESRDKVAEIDDDAESGVFPRHGAISPERARMHKRQISQALSEKAPVPRSAADNQRDIKREIPAVFEAASKDDIVYKPSRSGPSQATMNNSTDIAYTDPHSYAAIESQNGYVSTQRDLRKAPTSAPTSAPRSEPRSEPRLEPALPPGVERAAVQRVQHSSASSRDSPTTGGRVSSNSNRDPRPLTGASGASQVSSKIKGIITRESGDNVRHAIPRGTSADISREITRGSSRSEKSSDKEQDFEQLIRSDETIQYTLTPQNMREMEVSIRLSP